MDFFCFRKFLYVIGKYFGGYNRPIKVKNYYSVAYTKVLAKIQTNKSSYDYYGFMRFIILKIRQLLWSKCCILRFNFTIQIKKRAKNFNLKKYFFKNKTMAA